MAEGLHLLRSLITARLELSAELAQAGNAFLPALLDRRECGIHTGGELCQINGRCEDIENATVGCDRGVRGARLQEEDRLGRRRRPFEQGHKLEAVAVR